MASFQENHLSISSSSTNVSAPTQEPRPPLSLTTLPKELQFQIFSLACKHEYVIEPQYRDRWDASRGFMYHPGFNSDNFFCPSRFRDADDRAQDFKLAFTAMSLALTCKSIYALMPGDLLFYKTNSFSFPDANQLNDFMRGIKLEKAKAIQSIKLEVSGWPAGCDIEPLSTERWENVRSLELRLIVWSIREEPSNIDMGLPHLCYRNLTSVTIVYWSALKHRFFWYLNRTTTKSSLDASQSFQQTGKFLRDDLKMINVDKAVTKTISEVTSQWDGACKIDAVYETGMPMVLKFGVP